jgi:hypothetical protein
MNNNDCLFSYILSSLVLAKKTKHIALPILNIDVKLNQMNDILKPYDDVYKNYSQLSFSDIELILVGCIMSFISALLVIKWFIKFVSRYSFIGFGFYRIILGLLVLLFLN